MSRKTMIKICGLTTVADCRTVSKHPVDFAGFIMTESRRQVSVAQAAFYIRHLDRKVKPIGVFTDESSDYIRDAAAAAGLAGVQLHGAVDLKKITALRRMIPHIAIWQCLAVHLEQPPRKSMRFIQQQIDQAEKSGSQPDVWLLDSRSRDLQGGTGKSFAWDEFTGLCHKLPLAVAGGLNPENVDMAILCLRPRIVDCCGGVETGGIKDPLKIAAFCATVQNADGEREIG